MLCTFISTTKPKKLRRTLVGLTTKQARNFKKNVSCVIRLHYLLIVQFESRITDRGSRRQASVRPSCKPSIKSMINRYTFTDQKRLRIKLGKHRAIRRLFTTHSVLTVIHPRHQWRNVAVIIDRSLLYSSRHDLLNGLKSLHNLK